MNEPIEWINWRKNWWMNKFKTDCRNAYMNKITVLKKFMDEWMIKWMIEWMHVWRKNKLMNE